MKVDYIIVGQGLAGSAMAVQLLKRNRSIVVYDDPQSNNSSRIAAGLFNPVTGKKMVKTWLADTVFPYLHRYYKDVESISNKNFFHPHPIYRPFLSVEEQNEWMVRSGEKSFSEYVEKIHFESISDKYIDPYGGLLLRHSGFLNTNEYIQAVSELIRGNGNLHHEIFVPEEIIFGSQGVSYRGYEASKIIWCSGVHKSRFFEWLPIRPLKGETLTISAVLPEETILNRGVYFVPDNLGWRVGSTYYFQDTSAEITTMARHELELKIKELIRTPFKVIDHQWGFRPTTPDRRPILGAHPDNDRMIVFNGLGTKGISLAPYFSEVLVHWLEKGEAIHKEVDIDRFKSVYSGSAK